MRTNADITVYNRKLNTSSKRYEYNRIEIHSVWLYVANKVSMTEKDKGLESADMHKIRIPKKSFPDGYLSPEAYFQLPSDQAKSYWTIENGDLFVKGIVKDEITKESDLQNKGYLVGKVLNHSENFFGCNQHIRIEGA